MNVSQQRELHIAHPITTSHGGRSTVAIIRWVEGEQTWERLESGDYVVRWASEPHEYLLPSTSVKFERRPKTNVEKKK